MTHSHHPATCFCTVLKTKQRRWLLMPSSTMMPPLLFNCFGPTYVPLLSRIHHLTSIPKAIFNQAHASRITIPSSICLTIPTMLRITNLIFLTRRQVRALQGHPQHSADILRKCDACASRSALTSPHFPSFYHRFSLHLYLQTRPVSH